MFDTWIDFESYAEDVKAEAGFIVGYKTLFQRAGLLPEQLEEGLEICRKAHNIRMGVYRALEARDIARKKQATLVMAGREEDPALVKEIDKAEDKVMVLAYHVLKLKQPLDDYLYDIEMTPRAKYNVKDDALYQED